MTAQTIKADFLAIEASEVGEHLWRAIELVEAIPDARKVVAFGAALQQITEEIGCEYERKLFEATAMQAIPIVLLSAAQRKEIANAKDDAWMAYVRFLADGEAQDAGDFRASEREMV